MLTLVFWFVFILSWSIFLLKFLHPPFSFPPLVRLWEALGADWGKIPPQIYIQFQIWNKIIFLTNQVLKFFIFTSFNYIFNPKIFFIDLNLLKNFILIINYKQATFLVRKEECHTRLFLFPILVAQWPNYFVVMYFMYNLTL